MGLGSRRRLLTAQPEAIEVTSEGLLLGLFGFGLFLFRFELFQLLVSSA